MSLFRRRHSSLGPVSYYNSNKNYTKNHVVSGSSKFHVVTEFNLAPLFDSWGRGHPDQYTEAMTLGGDDGRYDSMDDKKPRAGQILWIRGLTRLQTQVSNRRVLRTFLKFIIFRLLNFMFLTMCKSFLINVKIQVEPLFHFHLYNLKTLLLYISIFI